MAKDFGSRKGTRKVAVPDLSLLSITNARTALSNLGLIYSDSSTNTGTSGDNEKVFEQSPAAGTIVLIGSTVSIGYYTYVAPPYFPYFPYFPPFFPPSFGPYFPYFPIFVLPTGICTAQQATFAGCSSGSCIPYGYGALC